MIQLVYVLNINSGLVPELFFCLSGILDIALSVRMPNGQ